MRPGRTRSYRLVKGVAALIYLDTHVVIWLYSGHIEKLTPRAVDTIENEDVLISPMVSLELQYLFETQRIAQRSDKIVSELSQKIGLAICDQAFSKIIAEANRFRWTRDPFDRIITATASLQKRLLLTKDSTILSHYKWAFWN
jgi:PIN domain nuclease of toxin-antitoxin system